MSDQLNANAVDQVIGQPGAGSPAGDVVQIQAAELVRLRDQANRFEAVERSTRGYVLESELSKALAARTDLVEGGAEKLARLVRDDLEATRDRDGWLVRSRDGKTVDEHLKAYLADPANALFLRAGSNGGANANATRATATSFTTADDPIARRNALAAAYMSGGGGGARNAFRGSVR